LDHEPLRRQRGKAIQPEQSPRKSVDRPDPGALICGGRILAGFVHVRAPPLPESLSAADQHDEDLDRQTQFMNTESLSRPRVDTLAGQRAAVGLSSLVLGLVFVYFVGFAPISAVHNAAHDTRHTAAFPCH
jgi:cobalt transporter subunit CbtB